MQNIIRNEMREIYAKFFAFSIRMKASIFSVNYFKRNFGTCMEIIHYITGERIINRSFEEEEI